MAFPCNRGGKEARKERRNGYDIAVVPVFGLWEFAASFHPPALPSLLCPMDKSADPMIASPLVRSPFLHPHEYSGLPDPCSSAGSVVFTPRFLLARCH